MENLSERFNVLQDQLMNIYEAAEQTLEAQITHWTLLRKEAVLLHFARQKGVTRLGYQPVPPLAVTEAKAKEAIGMMLQLQSLQKSEYASETWTLVDTSTETFRSAPENHFKKGPVSVEVIYDKDPENANAYTMWNYVYYMDSDDVWHKTTSGVNQTGIYYMHGNFKHYYVVFADDASRYSATGQWEVKVNKETVFAPVTSSTPPGSPGQTDTNASSTTPTTTSDSASRHQQPQQTEAKGRQYGRRPSSRTRRQETQQRRRRSRSRYRSRSRSRSRSRAKSQAGLRAIRATSISRSRSPSVTQTGSGSGLGPDLDPEPDSQPPLGEGEVEGHPGGAPNHPPPLPENGKKTEGRGEEGATGGAGDVGEDHLPPPPTPTPTKRRRTESVRVRGVSPDEVGKSLHTVSARNRGELGRLLEEALDPPVILCRGEANTLKCFRNRAKKKYEGLFRAFSTTWSWVAGDSIERLGRPRMLISFASDRQRKHFDVTVKYPKGVETSYGNLDSL
ncbi:E2 protein [Human papillomavirus 105]|uniref:Regulatory protein E2 n=1 Tax=Human papillomavirus 105 TaxID=587350 RepID=C4PUF0_9PAPI|nr:E2 protein [Human papillomavirus 105]